MRKGLVRVLEVFLAVQLLVIMLGSMQFTQPPGHKDPYNMQRLKSNADNVVQSICNNKYARETISENGTLPNINITATLQKDLEHAEKLYNGTYFSTQIDSNNDFPDHPGIVTSSCLVTGHAQNIVTASNDPSNCDSEGSTCTSQVNSSDDTDLELLNGETAQVKFPVNTRERGYKNTLIIEAQQNTSTGSTDILITGETSDINTGTLQFNTTSDERKTLNLTDYLPDANNAYNVTLSFSGEETNYDHIQLNITRKNPYYKSYKILAGVWNK